MIWEHFILVWKLNVRNVTNYFQKWQTKQSHKIVHTYKPYTCPFCDTKTLKTKSYLAKHIKRNHKAVKISKEVAITVNKEKKWLNETIKT